MSGGWVSFRERGMLLRADRGFCLAVRLAKRDSTVGVGGGPYWPSE
jgi:hypothetical protein